MNPSPQALLDRRRLLQGAGVLGGLNAVGLAGCATPGLLAPAPSAPRLPPVRAEMDRVFDMTVCLRPFRAEGPRMDAETIGDTLVVHNYGHGGSGWSLSWGSGTLALQKAMSGSPRKVAVVGCGALGLTSAILAQKGGAEVTIYAKDLLPQSRSARASGVWTPSSRIALEKTAGPAFADTWEAMARTSWKTWRGYLGLPGDPVRWQDRYNISDLPPEQRAAHRAPDPLGFADYEPRIHDLDPDYVPVPAAENPFAAPYVRRGRAMTYNIASLGHTLMGDFLQAGGRFVRTEFHTPADIAALPEKVVINCPGYGARALWKDESVHPVRGQIGWLVPQPEVNYGFVFDGVSVVSRTDGVCVQVVSGGDIRGYDDANETIDPAETAGAVAQLAALNARVRSLARA